MIKRISDTRAEKGFTLIELLLSLSLGSLMFVVLLQLIGADLRLAAAWRAVCVNQRSNAAPWS